jgi:hypothetical protein
MQNFSDSNLTSQDSGDRPYLFDKEDAIKEFEDTYKKISLKMTQTEFQREVGRLEVLGELLIREK